MIRENVFRLRKDVLNEGLRDDSQKNFAIDAAEGEVVDLVTEGRNVVAFGGIDFHCENVVAVEVNMRREFKRERRVASLVFTQTHAVEPDGGGGHHSFKVDEDTLVAGGGGQAEAAAINGDELVGFLVEAVPRHAEIGMGHGDAGKVGVVKVAGARRGRGGGAITPIAIEGQQPAALSLWG